MNRFFAFGCSYTSWRHPTWADYIGVNFDEYYNFARSGASNTYIANRLIEADILYTFNSNDIVVVMLTGVSRFSYCDKNFYWHNNGDLYNYVSHNPKSPLYSFTKNIWNQSFAVYQTWIATKNIKKILDISGAKYTILMGIDNSHYLQNESEEFGNLIENCQKSINMMNEVYDIMTLDLGTKSFDEWLAGKKKHIKYDDGCIDNHPHFDNHLAFAKEYFPEYISKNTKRLHKKVIDTFDYSNENNQSRNYSQIQEEMGIYNV